MTAVVDLLGKVFSCVAQRSLSSPIQRGDRKATYWRPEGDPVLTELKGSDRPKHAIVTAGTGAEEAKAPSCHHHPPACVTSGRRSNLAAVLFIFICHLPEERRARGAVYSLQATGAVIKIGGGERKKFHMD